jgi:hypothetical protein
LNELESNIGYESPNKDKKPVFKPKKRDNCALYKFIIAIVILRPVLLVAANVLVAIKVTGRVLVIAA